MGLTMAKEKYQRPPRAAMEVYETLPEGGTVFALAPELVTTEIPIGYPGRFRP
ncbi:hypothetical protein LQ567_13945 [Niabella pedocola]|uniref:Uncharacterized protein n=1 Tax=Niabella pedocola TaxID=1752077 RepID=A0ABS8PST9_9BACT|nr:hypothetical protein [Niabella pedocola]MCD2423874.1 hypothetical protein [Niabella pedocola]